MDLEVSQRLKSRDFGLRFPIFFVAPFAQFRLAVRGHTLLVLDDSGSRVPLTEAELLGLEVVSKPGSEGIPPMVGLKMAQPQDIAKMCIPGKGQIS